MVDCIVLMVLDCLRADHVSAYGYPLRTTPTLDAMAARGTLWDNVYSTSSWTRPSVTSLFTGLYPAEHGVIEGIKRSEAHQGSRVSTDVLAPSVPTLAEALSARGWRCAAFTTNFHLGEFSGLQRGFHRYHTTLRKADQILQAMDEWLEEQAGQQTFVYLHLLETHWPYKPRRRHIRMFGGDRDTNLFRDHSARDLGRLRRRVLQGAQSLTEQELTHLTQMYDGAVRRVDGKVKRMLQLLDERGLAERTAVFVTADHGEEFLEHGGIGHGQSLYDELIRVPLIATCPDGPRGARITTPVSHVQLPATICRLAGCPDGAGMAWGALPGRNPLLPVPTTPVESPVFGELRVRRRYRQMIRHGRYKLHRRFRFKQFDPAEDGNRTAWALHRSRKADVSLELYDVQHDPAENRNLATDPALASTSSTLRNKLDQWWQAAAAFQESHRSDEYAIDETVVARLRDLGYVD